MTKARSRTCVPGLWIGYGPKLPLFGAKGGASGRVNGVVSQVGGLVRGGLEWELGGELERVQV